MDLQQREMLQVHAHGTRQWPKTASCDTEAPNESDAILEFKFIIDKRNRIVVYERVLGDRGIK